MKTVLVNFNLDTVWVDQLKKAAAGHRIVVSRNKAEASEIMETADALITFLAKIDENMIARAGRLEWIQALTAGVDGLPLHMIQKRDIQLTNGRGIHGVHMAEYAVAAMINLARNLPTVFRNQMAGCWDPRVAQEEIAGKTLGIIGLGSIGLEIAKKAKAFDMFVIGVRRSAGPAENVDEIRGANEISAVFEKADFIINLLPLTEDTRNRIDRTCFEKMKPTACFINIGRGPTVHQGDLVAALQAGKMRAMASDVYAEEPLPAGHPLWGMENVLLTPHIAGNTDRYMHRAMEITNHNLQVFISGTGKMKNVVEIAKGY
jgi:D-2-hydroxyacid dehydrogenase (NADP+)